MKNLKKISITTLGTLSLLGTIVFASTGTVRAPNGLVLRQQASKTGAPITTLPDKASVEVIEENGEWYKVKYNSQEGYAFGEYIDVKEEIPPKENNEKESTPVKNKLRVYNIPLITSTVIDEIDTTAEIKVEKEIKNWSYISSGNIQGWVRTYGLNNEINVPEGNNTAPIEDNKVPEQEETTQTNSNAVEEPQKPADNSNSVETAVEISVGYVNVDFANIRKQASTNSEIVTTLTKGTSFKINAETEEWYKITYTSTKNEVFEGYIYKNLASK